MKVPRTIAFDGSPANWQYVQQQISRALAGGISFGYSVSNGTADQNMEASKSTGTTPATVDTEFAVAHNLGRVPIGYFIINQDQHASFKAGTTVWTATSIYLMCDTASVNYTLVVI